ncbi:MAG: winged helix-turn-helix transcriptional regulator [Chlorobiaceae bacterium]|nr:winged helix-turn-helix transcriptional regulator [Chlorobiaceae bacterium]
MQRTLSSMEYTVDEESIALISRALAHPVRVRILKLLAGETCCFTGELTGLIPMAQSTISQHLKALLDAGLIQGQIDPPKVKYCINADHWLLAQELFMGFFGQGAADGCDCD